MLPAWLRAFRVPRSWLAASALLILAIALGTAYTAAVMPANEHFQRTWARTDQPVANAIVTRTWMWGPDAFTAELQEPYAESPGGQRSVQYFDKARMEITQPGASSTSIWYVTNGLLVVELITGRMQVGDNSFQQRSPAAINVAGDADDPTGPTYATFGNLLTATPAAVGTTLTNRLSRSGQVSADPALASQGLTIALVDEVTNHAIAMPFWSFMTSSGTVWDGAAYVTAPLFENAYFATGRPITEAYWANVKVGGTYQDVLMQCFERRCLTYNPANAPEWRVEAGNVGRHYHAWRYAQPGGSATPTASGTPTATVLPSPSPTGTAETPTQYVPAGEWGGLAASISGFSPAGLGIDAQGDVWMTDYSGRRAIEFDADGTFVRSFGSFGNGNGQFFNPDDVAVDAAGNIFVVDSFHNRVQKFDPNGAYLLQWGSQGTGNGQFSVPRCIAVRGDLVYVCDSFNHRIQRFTLDGVFVGYWGSMGNLPGQFNIPAKLAFDASGNIYVADQVNDRIQKLDANGAYIAQFGSTVIPPAGLDGPMAVAVNDAGEVYALTFEDSRVVRFAADGTFLNAWGGEGSRPGEFSDPQDLAIRGNGDILVTDAQNRRIQVFDPAGEYLFSINDTGYGRLGNPVDLAFDPAENLIVADGFSEFPRIVTYSKSGLQLESVSYAVPETIERLTSPASVAANANGERYLTDSATNLVLRIGPDGKYAQHWGATGSGPGQFNNPQGITLDADGNVYVVDTGNNRIQKFDRNGVFLDLWGGQGAANGQFDGPSDIVVRGEVVYVTDTYNSRIQMFDRDGDYLGQWGEIGTGSGEFDRPIGVAVDLDGYVYVVDHGNGRIQKFDPEGEFVVAWGSEGGASGQFNAAWGIAADEDGYVYVTEQGNARLQVFRPLD
jgi:sugar lactone lactonase YvrE